MTEPVGRAATAPAPLPASLPTPPPEPPGRPRVDGGGAPPAAADRVDAPRPPAAPTRADALDRFADAYVDGARDRDAAVAWLRAHRDDWARLAATSESRLAASLEARLGDRVPRADRAGEVLAAATAAITPGLLREAVRREADARLHAAMGELARAAARPGEVAARLADPGDPVGARWRERLGLSGPDVPPGQVRAAVRRAEEDAHALRGFLLGQRWLPADVPRSTARTLDRLGLEDAPEGSMARRALGDMRDRWVHGAVIDARDATGRAAALGRPETALGRALQTLHGMFRVAAIPASAADAHLQEMIGRARRLGL